jgi:alpha-methylacyl-CoA racemase
MAGPLIGVSVVEFAGRGPGPFASMLLADMGASVTTIERREGQRHASDGHNLLLSTFARRLG